MPVLKTASDQNSASEICIKLENITKTFGGTEALCGVDLSVPHGQVHALLGKNGAGKSTLVKILMGVIQPDSGQIVAHNKKMFFHSPQEAQLHGIAMVFQELTLFANLTVAENLLMPRFPRTPWGKIDWEKTRQITNELLRKIGLAIDPFTSLAKLGLGQRQLVEIAKALSRQPKVLILDEPTSALSYMEQEILFKTINSLKQQGLSIIFITHRVKEVYKVSDSLTVLRDGKKVLAGQTADIQESELLQAIVGDVSLNDKPSKPIQTAKSRQESLIEIRKFSLQDCFHDVSFKLQKGEILGIVGLIGSGKTELAKAMFGLKPYPSGEMRLEGKIIQPKSPRHAIQLGIGLVPEDRKTEGLVPKMTMAANITLAALHKIGKAISISSNEEKNLVEPIIELTELHPPFLRLPAESFSGGNQQKIVLSRWLVRGVKVLILDEPTRGIDVGAKRKIYDLLRKLAGQGLGIIIFSSEFEEVHSEVTRLLVMSRGRIIYKAEPEEITGNSLLTIALKGE